MYKEHVRLFLQGGFSVAGASAARYCGMSMMDIQKKEAIDHEANGIYLETGILLLQLVLTSDC